MKVLFVGDAPSPKNTNPAIAFVGTKSGITLNKWADVLGVEYTAVNSNDPVVLESTLRYASASGMPVIALGRLAVERITRAGLRVKLHSLPHPSPRNRALNDKENVLKLLTNLKGKLND